MMIITVATANNGKIREIEKIFPVSSGVRVIPMSVVRQVNIPEENGMTFSENAVIKARAAAEIFSTHIIADDSGLVVDALNGEPGIYSARYMNLKTDSERNSALIEKMENIPDDKRTARFVCAIAHISPDGVLAVFEASCEGIIAKIPAGSGGFGYDPVFYLPEYNKTMAEIPSELKNTISHRARALRLFAENYNKTYGELCV
ncbi:MAG TPA: RdgB/HAM1 family non-canonical purine NTP pyrophosphatase [Spirochaetota bacterium]|nr:RdgB/HAM1 family non-canonical purine NTP pyrophosphatase [Spirochaetota bacterium]HPJ15982.1 RdgB/HAM1 family non-canonical purine NTP pyrophosphatase [Spirochaetota bacterium]HPY04072.1 RdgB/HAM1 family non-canonical purine NTP pyrophosphatase [Spirochaetota bacterium]HQA53610.1 RdgB/HAM1 family non-canonical purine NTP pyrophosphatase [Spirochaetota bacterium]